MPGWSRVESGITDTNYFVEDILPTKDYQFRVKAETQFGVSDPTLPVALERTKSKFNIIFVCAFDRRSRILNVLFRLFYLSTILSMCLFICGNGLSFEITFIYHKV